MIILIEDSQTQKFLGAAGQWTAAPSEGVPFASTRTACAAAKREPIGKFNIVLYFSDTHQIVNLDHGQGGNG